MFNICKKTSRLRYAGASGMYCGFLNFAMGYRVAQVAGLQGYKVAGLQGCKVTGLWLIQGMDRNSKLKTQNCLMETQTYGSALAAPIDSSQKGIRLNGFARLLGSRNQGDSLVYSSGGMEAKRRRAGGMKRFIGWRKVVGCGKRVIDGTNVAPPGISSKLFFKKHAFPIKRSDW